MNFKVDNKVVDIVPDSDVSRLTYPSGYEELKLYGDESTGMWYGDSYFYGSGWTAESAFQILVNSGYYYTTRIKWQGLGSVTLELGQCFIGVCRDAHVHDLWMILIKTAANSDTYLMRLINANRVDANDLESAAFYGRVVQLRNDVVTCVNDSSKFPMYKVNLKENGSEADPLSVLARGDGKALGATEHYELSSVDTVYEFVRREESIVQDGTLPYKDLTLKDFGLSASKTVSKGGIIELTSPYTQKSVFPDVSNFSVIIIEPSCVLLKVFPGIFQLITNSTSKALNPTQKVKYVYYAPRVSASKSINVVTKPNS